MGVVAVADDSHNHTTATLPFPFARYRTNDTLKISTTGKFMKLVTPTYNPTNTYSIASNEITVPAIGYYEVHFQGEVATSTQNPEELEYYITVGGVQMTSTQNMKYTTNGTEREISISDIVYIDNIIRCRCICV